MVTQFPSWLRTYEDCPKRYRFRCIDRRPEKDSPAFTVGRNIHAALKTFFSLKVGDRSPERLIELLKEAWRHDRRVFARGDPELERDWGSRAVEMLNRSYDILDVFARPVALEQFIEVTVEDELTLKGLVDRIDRVGDRELKVIDYKSAKFPLSETSERERDVAAIIYALGVERLFPNERVVAVDYIYLGDAKVLRFEPTRQLIEEKLNKIRELVKRVEADRHWVATPSQLCAYCGYLDICPEGTDFIGPIEAIEVEELPF